MQREAAQFVTARQRILRHHAEAQETHQIAVRFRGTHPCTLCQIAQHHRARFVGQHVEQSETDFDRLDAGAQLFLAGLDAFVVGVGRVVRLGRFSGVGVGMDRAGAGNWRHERGAGARLKDSEK